VKPAVRKMGVSGGRPGPVVDVASRLSGDFVGKKAELKNGEEGVVCAKAGEGEEKEKAGTDSQLPVNSAATRQRLRSTSNSTQHQARTGGHLSRSASCRRTSKQELLQFLDLAIAH